ncbi:hypothetical protein [Bizionia myxarmorum]|nr:hypothetical protein [Bizionia myxarmorum]
MLDVVSSDRGILIPRVKLEATNLASPITSPENSLLVYNTETISDVTPGYYYWSIDSWNRLITEKQASKPKYFYMPSIAMPTNPTHVVSGDGTGFTLVSGVYRVDLYERYKLQFEAPQIKNTGAPVMISNESVLPANKLNYYITYYDAAVFKSVTVTDAGILSYEIVTSPKPSQRTFMNIVFAVKP